MLKRVLWVLVALFVLAGSTALAQTEDSVFESGEREDNVNEAGIPIGAFIFSPTIELIYEDKDNIYLDEDNKVDDKVYMARGRLMFELPFSENYFRLSYMPQWRDYDEYPFDEHWSHFLDFEVALDTPSGFELDLKNHLVRGVLEVPEVDPGRELVYGDDNNPFLSDRADIMAGYSFTETDLIGATLGYVVVDYDEPCHPEPETCFYDYDILNGGLSYRRDMNPLLKMTASIGFTQVDSDDTASYRDGDGWFAKVGFEGELAPRLATTFAVGYSDTQYDKVPGTRQHEYKGLTLDGGFQYSFGENTNLELELARNAYLSNFDNNAYYTASKIGVVLETRLVGGLFGSVGGFLQNNSYDRKSQDVDGLEYRDDDITRYYLGLGYHFNDLFSVRGNYRWEDRDSNITGYSYEARTILLNLIFGY